MTYGLFEALLDRKQAETEQDFLRAGIVAAAVINFSMGHPDEPVSPMQFVPKQKEEVDLSKLSPEEAARHVMGQFGKKKYA